MDPSEPLDVADLWKRYGDEMVRFARTRLAGISRAGEDAEDVVQEALLSLHRNPPSVVRNRRNLFYTAVWFQCATLISSNRGTKYRPIDPQSWRMRQRRAAERTDLDVAILVHSALSELCGYERAVAIHRLMYGQTAREVGLMLGLHRDRVTKIAESVAEELRVNLAVLDDGEPRLTPDELARRKRELLFQAADTIGVAAACRQFGVSTSSYHNWRVEEMEATA